MYCIKVDAALMVDSFSIFFSNYASIIWCHLKFKEQTACKSGFDLNYKEMTELLNLTERQIKVPINKFINYGLLMKNKYGRYFTLSERDLLNKLRNSKKEKFYTRYALFTIEKDFFYKFVKNIKGKLTFKAYYIFQLLSQHDLWPDANQIRCQFSMQKILKTGRLWSHEEGMIESLNELIDLGLVIVDQNHKLHTLKYSNLRIPLEKNSSENVV